MKKEKIEVLVIGAGPSGCIGSAYLQSKNIDVLVVEKAKFPRPVVGESLIPRVMDHLDEIGIIPALISEGFEKKWGARFLRGKNECVFNFSQKYGEGWDWTWQVPRADFDDVVAKEVQKQGVRIDFQSEVINVEFNKNGDSITTVRDLDGEETEIEAKFIIDSSGYGRVLPRLLNLEKPSSHANHSSIFTHIEDVNRSSQERGSLISFDILETEVWLWVIPFSNGKTSIGIVGPSEFIDKLSETGNTTEAMNTAIGLSEFYKERFEGLPFIFKPLLLKNYSRSVKQMYGKGYALTGNSSEFIDPVFSSGVAFATESGMLSAKLIARQLRGESVDWEKDYAGYMKRGINVFSTYVKEWYTGNLQTVFFHEPANQDIKHQICAVLAGYVWDETNPFVRKHTNVIKNIAHTIMMNNMLLTDFYHQEKFRAIDKNNFEVHIRINKKHDIFNGHFPGKPITPGVCMIQIIKNICTEIIGKPIVLDKSKYIKFTAIINPEVNPDLILMIQFVESNDETFRVKCEVYFEDTLALKLSSEYSILTNRA